MVDHDNNKRLFIDTRLSKRNPKVKSSSDINRHISFFSFRIQITSSTEWRVVKTHLLTWGVSHQDNVQFRKTLRSISSGVVYIVEQVIDEYRTVCMSPRLIIISELNVWLKCDHLRKGRMRRIDEWLIGPGVQFYYKTSNALNRWFGLLGRRAVKKPLISERTRKVCQPWAKDHLTGFFNTRLMSSRAMRVKIF